MKQKLIDNIDGMIAVLIFAKGIDPDSAYMMAEGKKSQHDGFSEEYGFLSN